MTKTDEEKKIRESKKKQRLEKFANGANYSNRLIRSFNNLKKRENKTEIKQLRSTNNVRKDLLIANSIKTKGDFSIKKPITATIWTADKGNLEFVPFLQERDGMGKLISHEIDDKRKVKIIRLNTKPAHREKDFSNSIDLKQSLTHIVYKDVIDTNGVKEGGVNANVITGGSFCNGLPDVINYGKFEIQKRYEPFYKERETFYNKTACSFRQGAISQEFKRPKPPTPCIGSYDYSTSSIFKKITKDCIFPLEHPPPTHQPSSSTMMNLSDIYQKLGTHRKLIEDFGKQIGRSQSLLKWAPAIHEMEKMKVKKKEQEFKEIDSKDLERDYHFNRYLQKKYSIKSFSNFYHDILIKILSF